MRALFSLILAGCLLLVGPLAQAHEPGPIAWQAWNDRLFQQARQQGKFVLLDLEAVWCHWCHVMDQTTYHDPAVVKLMQEKFIAVRVDQDADPALSQRYEDYGWPATIVFGPDGTEIVKRRGYLPPEAMASLLAAIIKDPTPGPSVQPPENVQSAADGLLADGQRQQLITNYFAAYDEEYGGWGAMHKFIHPESMEYALANAARQPRLATMAKQTLDAALALIDPVWGGVYQYSDARDWRSPHYEKIMSFQAQYLRVYAQAHRLWDEPRYLNAAKAIDNYLQRFLTAPEGGFYVSQDADAGAGLNGGAFYALSAGQRLQHVQPRVDKNIYARDNGWAIAGLAALYDATGDAAVLDRAKRAALWVNAHRRMASGGFRHGAHDGGAPVLGDSLAMGQAFLALYVASGERRWLNDATRAADFIERGYKDADGGFFTAPVAARAVGVFKHTVRQVDENIALARFANSLFHYTGNARYRAMTEHAMRYLSAAQLIESQRLLAGVLLADAELLAEPLHITIVGRKNDPQARALHRAALHYPASHRRIEWWDKREGAMPNPDVQYPELARAAAFICTNKTCSRPMYQPDTLTATVERLTKLQ